MARLARHKTVEERQVEREIKIKVPMEVRILLYLNLLGILANLYFLKLY